MGYRNNQRSGCLICVNEDLANVVNPLLISAEYSMETILEKLENDYGIYLTIGMLEKHAEHIIKDFDIESGIDDKVNVLKDISNLETINREIARLEVIEEELRQDQKVDTPAFSNILKAKQKYIEMRMRIEGEDKTVHEHTLPHWIGLIGESEMKIVEPELNELPEK